LSVIILKPRLDVTFKEGPVPDQRGPIQPIRQYWEAFVNTMLFQHKCDGDSVTVIERPLWQFSKDLIQQLIEHYNANICYVPHHCKKTLSFDYPYDSWVRYYMQMSFPFLFQIDKDGWCADASTWPIMPSDDDSTELFDQLKERQDKGLSKFPQPALTNDPMPEGFLLYACQLPHDQTIKLHSDVSVEHALRETIRWCVDRKVPLVIKPHPVNPGSMKPLFDIFMEYEPSEYVIWKDNININQLLAHCAGLVSVNSGVGMEAILHRRPVFTWGRADYDSVSLTVRDFDSFDSAWDNRQEMIPHYPSFINAYFSKMKQVRPLNNLFE